MPPHSRYEPTPGEALLVDGVTINYLASLRDNPDVTLVMVHGFGATLESWNDIYPSLASKFSVVRLDLQGSGFSSKPTQQVYGPVNQARILLRFIGSMGLRRVVLVGHSLGGTISLIAYLQGLDEKSIPGIIGLVLIDSPIHSQRVPFFIRALSNPVSRLLSELLPAETRVRLMLHYCMKVKSQITLKKVQTYSFALKLPGAAFALAQTARQLLASDVDAIAARIREVRIPTLVIWGRNDRVIPLENAYSLHAAIPTSTLVVLSETGHIPHEERPAEIVKVIRDFLEVIP